MYRIVNICEKSKGRRKHRHGRKQRGIVQDRDFNAFRDGLLGLGDLDFSKVEATIDSRSKKFSERFWLLNFLLLRPKG